jgi:hypothetical protein
MSKPWPPPPDLDSIQELVGTADIEGFIADGAPSDEYESEADALHAAIAHFTIAEVTTDRLIAIIEPIWRDSFQLDDTALAQRQPAIQALAQQIARFFGPEAKPQVRNA